MKRMSAFEIWVRWGRIVDEPEEIETKFNPWHDPDDGRFTFAGQGSFFGDEASRASDDNTDLASASAARGRNVGASRAPAKPKPRAAATPKPKIDFHGLGGLSASEEGRAGIAEVSNGSGDKGGISYGLYQLSSKKNVVQKFLKDDGARWASEFKDLDPTVRRKFGDKWKEIAAREPKAFTDAQNAFIGKNQYTFAVTKVFEATGLNLNELQFAVREATWSSAVQSGGAYQFLTSAVRKTDSLLKRGDPLYDRELLKQIYGYRTTVDHERARSFLAFADGAPLGRKLGLPWRTGILMLSDARRGADLRITTFE